MKNLSSISQLPRIPAVYALYGGQGTRAYVAYVGVADNLKARIGQHLLSRDSSVATGTSASGLNPGYVTEVKWWEHSDFTVRDVLEAAELIALGVLDPALRSRGAITDKARQLYATDDFQVRMRPIFQGEPTGHLILPSLETAFDRITALESRISALEHEHKARNTNK